MSELRNQGRKSGSIELLDGSRGVFITKEDAEDYAADILGFVTLCDNYWSNLISRKEFNVKAAKYFARLGKLTELLGSSK